VDLSDLRMAGQAMSTPKVLAGPKRPPKVYDCKTSHYWLYAGNDWLRREMYYCRDCGLDWHDYNDEGPTEAGPSGRVR